MAKKAEFAVSPFVILSDTREQNPWNFTGIRQLKKDGGLPVAVQVKHQAMETGDYSMAGFENIIAIERKSKEDFFQCCIQDRERFEKQLTRLNALEHPYLIVECSYDSIMRGLDGSAVNPTAIIQSVIAWQQELCPNVRWWFPHSRNVAETWAYRMFERLWRNYL